MPLRGCLLGQNPGYFGPGAGMGGWIYNGSVAKPLFGAGKAIYPGACKFIGYSAFAGKGACLGLGLGLGVFGPLLLVGAGVTAGYFILKGYKGSQKTDVEG
ncbi:MAG TPA: hypothetical protein HPP56_08975 [Nitrospirae bacterium]|nr:hypothetical protein [Nitrospirota bacterium]